MLRLPAALAALLLLPATASAADRYASPDGPTTTGAPCTQESPCAIGLAARDAAPGDVIRFTPGDYGTASTPLGYGIYSAAAGVTYVGHPRARMVIDNATDDSVLLTAGQTWAGEGMTIVTLDPGGFHAQGDAVIERLKVESRATGTGAIACNLEGGNTATPQAQIRNSVCVAAGGGLNSRGLSVQARTNGQDFRAASVTAIASGTGSSAVWMGNNAPSTADPFTVLRLDLVLAVSSGTNSLDIRSTVDGLDQRACVQTYDTRADSAKIASGFCNVDETNAVRDEPTFVDVTGNQHQRPGSLGIDPLTAAPNVPPIPADFDGLPRDAAKPDPGAYEYREAIVTTLAPSDVTTTTATLRGSFRGRYGTSIVRFLYAGSGVTPARFVDATGDAAAFTEQITGLQPNTEYTVQLRSAQADESDANGDVVTFRTAALPGPTPTPTPTPGPGTATPGTGSPGTGGGGGGAAGGGGANGGGSASAGKRCVVPKLKGLTLTTATKRLARANCKLGKVKGKRGTRARVSTQTVKAGRTLKAGTKVGVTLKTKPKRGRR